MSKDEFDSWLSLVGRLLGLNERQRKQISEELRDHLESRVADLVEDGMERQAAVMKAVEEFGDAAALAKNLQSVSLVNRKRWMMRFMTLATAGLFLVAVLTMAMWPENARFGSPSQTLAQDSDVAADADVSPSSRSRSDNEIRNKIKRVTDLVYDAEPFGDVLAELTSDLQVNIVVDSNLEGVLDENTEVSANLEGIRFSDGFRTLLRPADATFAIKNGVLLIISVDDETEPDYLSRHMIDVRELLELVKEAESDRIGKPFVVTEHGGFGGGGLGGGGGGGGVFSVSSQLAGGAGGAGESAAIATTQKTVKEDEHNDKQLYEVLTAERLLVDTITRVVNPSPDAWMRNGGSDCDLTCIGGVLVVLSHEAVAEDARDFVTDLEYQMKTRKD